MRRNSGSSADSLEAPVLVYHDSARSIVFRDQLRRAVASNSEQKSDEPKIVPLDQLELGPKDTFEQLLAPQDVTSFSEQERNVYERLGQQQCVVKTIKNVDWTDFLLRFKTPHASGRYHHAHEDKPAHAPMEFNSFVTSTSLLPAYGKKMRCYGQSTNLYTTGVVFGLPNVEEEDDEAQRTETWSWPAGYAAKTEFNVDQRGQLINGRAEALCPLSVLRQYNDEYLSQDSYMVALKRVSGLSQIPYNEVFLRVGGVGHDQTHLRSFDAGAGLPIALFVRSAKYNDLVNMVRTRARMADILGERSVDSLPLLLIDPEIGTRVFTGDLQAKFWKVASNSLMPFQNNSIAHKTTMEHTDELALHQKLEELLEFDETIQSTLTAEELARLAGGFGATDASVASVLRRVRDEDRENKLSGQESHKLQDVVNEGLSAAVRAGDYHTSRQLLLLYSLVAASSDEGSEEKSDKQITHGIGQQDEESLMQELVRKDGSLSTSRLPAPPPPPPLDTDRLRSATNSDGLLAVLGAAEVLKAMRSGKAKERTLEVVTAVDEWVEHGKQSMAFRISSWYDQRAAQGDLKINTESGSEFMAFVSNKAISNRKTFAQQLQHAASNTNFGDMRFLLFLIEILENMHSPCLRLELLQYVLGLDNRYSVAHVTRSVELAVSCMGVSSAASSV